MTKTVRPLTRQLSRARDLSYVRATVCVSPGTATSSAKKPTTTRSTALERERYDDDMTIEDNTSYDDNAHAVDGVARRYTCRDDRRTVMFTGVKLASVSSERAGVQRWTEIDIYRTDAGRYIVNRVGMSVVAHRIDCAQVATKKRYGIDKLMPDECPPQDREPCPLCRPDIQHLLSIDPASLTFEQDKHRTTIWERPEEMIDSMYSSPNQRAAGSLMLWALEEAAKQDPIIADAYNRAVVIE